MKNAIFLVFILLTLSACNNEVNPKDHLGEIYSLALNHIMEEEETLNDQMEFIAIDMTVLEDISEQGRQEILTFFKDKYKVDVMETTLEELKNEGYFNPDMGALDGVLLRIEKVEENFHNNVFIEGSKYRTVDGGFRMEMTINYKEEEWEIKKSKITGMG